MNIHHPASGAGMILILFTLSAIISCAGDRKPGSDSPHPVDAVDLERYIGTWYEISKIPNRFQRKCARGTTATYSLRDDGMIDVVNRCIKEDSGVIEAKGIARVADAASNARLEVSFVRLLGLSLFWGDYWIIGLGNEYEYAIVGHPQRRYGWILSRTPRLTPVQQTEINAILKKQGYDPDDFIPTPHPPDRD